MASEASLEYKSIRQVRDTTSSGKHDLLQRSRRDTYGIDRFSFGFSIISFCSLFSLLGIHKFRLFSAQ